MTQDRDFEHYPFVGFFDTEAARAVARKRRAGRAASVFPELVDHGDQVLDGEAKSGVMSRRGCVLRHEASDDKIGALLGRVPGLHRKEGDGYGQRFNPGGEHGDIGFWHCLFGHLRSFLSGSPREGTDRREARCNAPRDTFSLRSVRRSGKGDL